MKEMIIEYIKKEYLDEDEADDMALDENTPLISSGIVDSFSMVSLKRFLEKKYGVMLPDEEANAAGVRHGDEHHRAGQQAPGEEGGVDMAYPAAARDAWQAELAGIREKGIYKEERFIHSPQVPHISVEFPSGSALREVVNLCANNYLGLSS